MYCFMGTVARASLWVGSAPRQKHQLTLTPLIMVMKGNIHVLPSGMMAKVMSAHGCAIITDTSKILH